MGGSQAAAAGIAAVGISGGGAILAPLATGLVAGVAADYAYGMASEYVDLEGHMVKAIDWSVENVNRGTKMTKSYVREVIN